MRVCAMLLVCAASVSGCAGVLPNPCLAKNITDADGTSWHALRREPANAGELLAQLPGALRRNRTDWYATDAGALRVYVGNEVANQTYDFVPSQGRLIYRATEHESDRTICVHD